ncbi:uncharacterized protein LOC119097489 [Pollicipes pollicipes]|uniref:uncharacterized protein LOC119097489 n=1 Tax=Pollicipes pollicipes TaxID=41117 RepID=UPI0018855ADE|nr:uncharacterized protein LOC119097489 [Pollicipes pollicipes]
MGKSSKAKKEKKADFTKVKLKVGKKLPKGQNLTDTSFKSKKIVIHDQAKKQSGDGPVTKKKLSLKELLSHLRHYSAYVIVALPLQELLSHLRHYSAHVRQDGLAGLRELLTRHGELVWPALGQLLPALAALLVDEDHKLRAETVLLVSDVIGQGLVLAAPAGQERRLLHEPAELRQYAASVAPLLFQTYAEVAPDLDGNGSLLSDEAAETLAVVLQVLVELLKRLRHLDITKNTALVAWFTESQWTELSRHVFASFPYSRLVGRRRKGAESGTAAAAAELGSDVINVLSCELSAGLEGGGRQETLLRTRVLDYVTAYLESDRLGELDRVCRVLPALLAAGRPAADLERRLGCVRAAAERHGRVQTAEQGTELTRLLAAIITEPEFDDLARSEDVENWATQLLPSVKFGADSLELLVLLRKMAAMGRTRFLRALESEMANLISVASAVPSADDAISWQRSIIELLFWPKDVRWEAKVAFQRFLDASETDESVKHYAREVLLEKFAPLSVEVS